jgi:transposase
MKWIYNARFIYNNTLAEIKKNGIKSKLTLRNELSTFEQWKCPICNSKKKVNICKKCNVETERIVNENLTKELAETPSQIREGAVFSCVEAYKTSMTNKKNKNIKHFELKFKTKKNLKSDSFTLDARTFSINENGLKIYKNLTIPIAKNNKIRKKKLKDVEEINASKIGASKLNYNIKSKEFYALISVDYTREKCSLNNIYSCDPGVKTFQTIYDSETGNHISLNQRRELLIKLNKKISDMQNKRIKVRCERCQRFNGIISDCHWRWCSFISNNCGTVLLPHFESQDMKIDRAKGFNYWLLNVNKHYQFAEKLKWCCWKKGVNCIRINEAYTTKTCGKCGELNNNITLDNRVFNCENCDYRNVDRDYHSARNILIKFISGYASSP